MVTAYPKKKKKGRQGNIWSNYFTWYHDTWVSSGQGERGWFGMFFTVMSPTCIAVLATNVPVCFSHPPGQNFAPIMSWEKSHPSYFQAWQGASTDAIFLLQPFVVTQGAHQDSKFFQALLQNNLKDNKFGRPWVGTRDWHFYGSTQSLVLDLNSCHSQVLIPMLWWATNSLCNSTSWNLFSFLIRRCTLNSEDTFESAHLAHLDRQPKSGK